MRVHELDIREDFFYDILSGNKKHEIRMVKEKPYDTNDILHMKEIGLFDKSYTGRELKLKVTYLTPINIGHVYNLVVMSFTVEEGINV